jgi:SAM-dependent methyltransferase
MEPREIADVYDRIGHHWAGPLFPAANGIAAHARALTFLGARRGAALDVGCGANPRLRHWLLAQGFAVEGVDLSPRMLALARRAQPELTFYQADICEWTLPRRYDFISAWDSIWHVPLQQQPGVIAKLCAALELGGVLVFTSGGLDEPNEVTNPCHGVPLYHATPGVPAILRTLHEAGATLRHYEFDQWPESHVYFVAQEGRGGRNGKRPVG